MAKVILIVEDEEQNMKLLRDLLQVKGYDTLEASNGEEGVLAAFSEQPDLILMDIQMPVKDGIQASREIKASPVTRTIPIIALTAYAMKGDRERISKEGGFDGYMSKPIDIRALLEAVAGFLQAPV